MVKKIMICGSGTGGHFFPAYAFYESLKKLTHAKLIFVGVGKPMENVLKKDPALEYIKVKMVSSSLLRSNFIAFFFFFFVSIFQAFFLLLFNRPSVLVCFGGYTSLPIGIVARFLFIRTVVHEQNEVMGRANKILRSLGAKCYSHFKVPGTHQLHNPLRYRIIERRFFPDKSKFNIKNDNRVILITGGSQGATTLNDTVFEIINKFMEDSRFNNWDIIHIVGDKDGDYKRGRVHGNNHHRYQCYRFLDNIDEAYAISDIAITRGGSLTLSELHYFGIRKIIVPYPYASDDHQTKNALVYESAYEDKVIPQELFTPELLYEVLLRLTEHTQPKEQLSYEGHIREMLDEYSGEKLANIILNGK